MPYLPTLPVFPGVSKFFMKSPSLPVRASNLPGTSYCGSFLFINFVGNVLLLHWKKWNPKKRSATKNGTHFENVWGNCLQGFELWWLAGM